MQYINQKIIIFLAWICINNFVNIKAQQNVTLCSTKSNCSTDFFKLNAFCCRAEPRRCCNLLNYLFENE